jgi:hypothetical protein
MNDAAMMFSFVACERVVRKDQIAYGLQVKFIRRGG